MLPEKCDIVLVAGGSGSRFRSSSNSDVPKQFELIHGRPLYLWSLDVFLNWPITDSVVVVVPEDWVLAVQESFKILDNLKIKVVCGGKNRQESAALGVATLEDSLCDWVMIHDAARPAITTELLDRVWLGKRSSLASDEVAAVVPGLRPSETIKMVNEAIPLDIVTKTMDRESLRVIQTPQLLNRDLLELAYNRFRGQGAVDDSSLIEKLGYKCVVVDGSYDNVKVTFNEDQERVSHWLRNRHPSL